MGHPTRYPTLVTNKTKTSNQQYKKNQKQQQKTKKQKEKNNTNKRNNILLVQVQVTQTQKKYICKCQSMIKMSTVVFSSIFAQLTFFFAVTTVFFK